MSDQNTDSNAAFGSSPVNNANFLNAGLPNFGEFIKYMNANKGRMDYPIRYQPRGEMYRDRDVPYRRLYSPAPNWKYNNPYRIQYGKVVDQRNPFLDELPTQHTTKEGRTYTYWEYPQRIGRYHDMIKTAAPGWTPPDWLDVDKVNEAYDYLKFRNNNTNWSEWKALPANDPGISLLQSMAAPQIDFRLPSEVKDIDNQVLTDAQVKAQQPIDWYSMPKFQRFIMGLVVPQTENIANRPEWTRLSASGLQSILLALGVGVGASAIAGPWVGIPLGLAVAGGLTYQAYTGKEVPVANELMLASNLLSESLEKVFGLGKQSLASSVSEVMDEFPAAWQAGAATYESGKANYINQVASVFNFFSKDENDVRLAGPNEVWQFERGITEPVKLPEGVTKGKEYLDQARNWIDEGSAQDEFNKAVTDEGYTGTYREFLLYRLTNDFGITGVVNDLVAQTVLDPLNVLPWMIGKAGGATFGKVSTMTKNPATARVTGMLSEAFKQGTGNLAIDALPFGVQQLAAGITKMPSSQGLMGTMKIYQDWIRQGTVSHAIKTASADIRAKYDELVKSGIDPKDIKPLDDVLTWTDKLGRERSYKGKGVSTIELPKLEDLSPFEKWIGGLDDTYGLKELRPTAGRSFLTKFVSLQPDSQVSVILTSFHHNIATLMDMARGKPEQMVDLIQKLSGMKEIKPGEAGYNIISAPANKAVMSAMQYAFKDGDISANMLGSWVAGAERRGILEKIALAIDTDPNKTPAQKVADTIQRFKDNPEEVSRQLNKIAPDLKTTPEALKKVLDVFVGDDPMPWSAEQFQANLVNSIAKKMDGFFEDKYGLTQENWVFRASNALKGVQSLVLLGFNPAYFFNNWVNNVVTRAADGIGGYMSNKQVGDFYTRMGIFPRDSGLSMYNDITGSVIRNAREATDVLSKAQKGINFLNKAGIFSRLSAKIEKLEGNQARVIAMKQYMDSQKAVGKGIRAMDPQIEIMLDQRYPGLKERIYSAVRAGLNMDEIESSLFSTEVRPSVDSIIDEMEARFPGTRELFTKANVSDMLRDEMANVKTPEELAIAIENVTGKLQDWVSDQTSRAIINGVDEEFKNITDAERIPAVLKTFGDMVIDNANKWLKNRAEWEGLYSKWDELHEAGRWDTEVKKLERTQRADWVRTRDYELNTHQGIIKSIGIENEHTQAFVAGLGEYHNVWKNYWDQRGKLYDEYYSIRRESGETYEAYSAKKQRAWDALQDAQAKLYDDATMKEMEIQRRMDASFAAMYAKYTGWDATGAAKWRSDLWGMRQEIIDLQKSMRERTRNMTPAERDAAYKEFNPIYQQKIAAMKQFEHDGAFMLMNKPSDGAKIEIPTPIEPDITPVQPVNPVVQRAKDVVKAKLSAETIYREADDAKRRAMIQQNGQLGRDAIQTAFIENFPTATREQVTVAMALFDLVIDRWAVRNGMQPGKAAQDAWYATHIDRIESGDGKVDTGALEKLDQLMQNERIDTPEFRNWFGESIMRDGWGNPIVYYHGTRGAFVSFKRRTGDVGIHFGTKGQAIDRLDYTRKHHPDLGDNVIPVYLKIENPLRMDDIGWWNAENMNYYLLRIFPEDTKIINRLKSTKDVRQYIQSKGYDGIVYRNTGEVEGGSKFYSELDNARKEMYDSQRKRGKPIYQYDEEDRATPEYARVKEIENKYIDYRHSHAEDSFIVFEREQIKSVFNEGTFDPNNPNILKQGEVPKGSYKLLSDGSAILKGFQAGDISTMVHEMAHVFRRDLPAADLDVVAQHAGLVNGIELRELEQAFMEGRLVEGTPEYIKYVKAEEDFARGWERYLTEGDAPTPQMKSIFRQFTDWMLTIYDKLRRSGSKVLGFEGTKLDVDITAKVNGQSLKDVFDRMLVDKPNRTKSYGELLADKVERVKNTGRNHKFSETDLTTMAHRELLKDVLGRFASEEEARAYTAGMTDYDTINGSTIDDATMNEALQYVAAHPEVSPWNVVSMKKVAGKKATADTPKGDTINMQYKVIDLDDLEASDNWYGNTVQPNPNYNQELQKRIRGEKSSVAWMIDKAKPEVFNPKQMLDEYNSTDRGTPIIVMDNQVWSGNGRVNAVRYSVENNLGAYDMYRASLDEYAARAGIDPESYADMQHPFLVREITDDLTPDQLESYAADSNKGSSASMSEFENAVNEGARITDESLMTLEVGDTESIEGAIQAARNDMFVKSYLSGFDTDALKDISYNLKLTAKGITRIVNALLAKVYQGASGEKLVRIMANGDKSLVQNPLKVLKDTLPQVAVLEGKIATGQLDAGLKISDDLSVAIDVLDRIRQNPKMNVNEYINTQQLVKETTPFQDMMIEFLDTAKPTEARQTIRNYVAMALLEPDPRQMDMFGDTPHKVKEEIFNDARTVGKLEGEQIDALIAAGQTTAPTSRLAEQPIDTGAGEGIGGVQRGSETVPGIPEPEIPRPASGEPAAVRQPWEMTRDELLTPISNQSYRSGLDLNEAIVTAGDTHKLAVQQALSEGKPVPPEVLADYPDLVAKSVINAETKADYDAGQPIPIERAAEIDITHQDALPVPMAIEDIINTVNNYRYEKRQLSSDYIAWVVDGEYGARPDGGNPELARIVYEELGGALDTLREYAKDRSRGITIDEFEPQISQPGIVVQKSFKFTHGDIDCVANVYKDGELIAYVPVSPIKDMAVEDGVRVLGLDPQFPDRIVYEQDGVIKTVDSRKPEVDGQSELFQSGQLDMFSQSAEGLPLFSGTPMRAEDVAFRPREASQQMSLFPDIVPQAKPTRMLEISIIGKDGTSRVRLDMKDMRKIRETLKLHEGAEMTARILDANGKVMESNLDPNNIVNPRGGSGELFQAAEPVDTPEFKAWFGESKVVDSDGNPLVVYHGSPYQFEQFDFVNLRENGTSEGVGFYYIDNEEIARGYARNSNDAGYLYSGYLTIKKPMDISQKKITKNQWKQIIGEIEKTNPEALANYGDYTYYGRDKVLNDAINIEFDNADSDIDIISSFGNGGMADFETINRAVVKMTGYDGVVVDWSYKTTPSKVYVAFLPEQFKSINNEGTWDKTNPNFLKQEPEPTPPNDAPMGRVPLNGTPMTEPFARTMDELYTEHIRPMLSEFETSYKGRMGDKAFNWGDVSDADRKTVRQYLNGTVTNDLAEVKRAALTYGDSMRNGAMLDYGRRYGFDNYLNIIAPYQFWYTRSMVNWSKRMIDKPAWFAMYARLQKAQERMEREGMPSRLKGKARFNMAWMPDWMGGGLWTDPMNKIFPFDQFGQPFEQFTNNQTMVYRRAEQVIDDMRTAEKITSEQAKVALDTQKGDIWDQAINQAEMELDKSASPMSLPTMMLQPALWWTMAANAVKGTPEKNSVLPITRTGQTMKELGKNTFLEPFTSALGGLMAGPETAIRKKAGLSEFGQWGDYYVDRTLAGMAAAGEISAEDARIAMIERQGEVFQQAYSRVQTEQALRTPGAAGVMAFKETVKNGEGVGTVAGQTLAGFLAGMFGGSLFSEGELKMRGLKPIYDNAWRKFDAGDEDAINQFFEDYPEYYARLALYDEPEERLHQFLIDSVWRNYMALDKENKYLARDAMGDEFMDSFLNKETRAYDAISDETLAQWSQMLGQSKLPNVEEIQGAQGTQPIDLYDQTVLDAINAYKAEKTQRFPNVTAWQESYYALPPGAQRKAFLKQHPMLKEYWDWKDEYAVQNPDIVPYFEELKNRSTGDQASSEVSSPLIRQLLSYATGGQLTAGAKAELERIRQMYAPQMDSEDFTTMMIQLVLSGQ